MRFRWLVLVALAWSCPLRAQDMAGILQIDGQVMVGVSGGFGPAVDRQPVAAGQRIMVPEGGSATVTWSGNCKQTFSDAGVYTLLPGNCRDDRKRQNDSRASANETPVASEASTLPTTLWLIGGTLAITIYGLEQLDDDPVSR